MLSTALLCEVRENVVFQITKLQTSTHPTIHTSFSERLFTHQWLKHQAYSSIEYHHALFASNVFHIFCGTRIQSIIGVALCLSQKNWRYSHSNYLTVFSEKDLVFNIDSVRPSQCAFSTLLIFRWCEICALSVAREKNTYTKISEKNKIRCQIFQRASLNFER